MKQIIINTYTAQELKGEFPKGFERAHEQYKRSCYDYGIAWTDEIMESMKQVFEHTDGIRLKDYDIGYRGRGVTVSFDQDEAEDLSGARAQAWIENNLLYKLRIPYEGKERKRLAQYGQYYRPGMIKPCPFTGYCADDDYLDSLRDDIKAGCTLREAFENLGNVAERLIDSEWEDQLSEEYFIDHASANGWTFDEDGRML